MIDSLPTVAPLSDVEVFDVEIATNAHVDASVDQVLPLPQELLAGAAYVKYHPANGWPHSVEDGQNKIASAPTLAGQLGICPSAALVLWTAGFNPSHACVRISIEDGGPNDVDRLLSDGCVAADRGLNGNIKDPAASTPSGESAFIETALKGTGAMGPWWLLALLAGAMVRHPVHALTNSKASTSRFAPAR